MEQIIGRGWRHYVLHIYDVTSFLYVIVKLSNLVNLITNSDWWTGQVIRKLSKETCFLDSSAPQKPALSEPQNDTSYRLRTLGTWLCVFFDAPIAICMRFNIKISRSLMSNMRKPLE